MLSSRINSMEFIRGESSTPSNFTYIKISGNPLTSMPTGLHQFGSTLVELIIRVTNIDVVSADDIRELSVLKKFVISSTQLQWMADMTGMFNLTSSPTLSVDSNSLVCDHRLAWIKQLPGKQNIDSHLQNEKSERHELESIKQVIIMFRSEGNKVLYTRK